MPTRNGVDGCQSGLLGKKNVLFILATLLLTVGSAYAQGSGSVPLGLIGRFECSIYSIYSEVRVMIFIVAIFLMVVGAAIYAGAHVLPSQAKGNAQGYAMGMILGAVAGIILAVLSPYALQLVSNGTASAGIANVTTFCNGANGVFSGSPQVPSQPGASNGPKTTSTIPIFSTSTSLRPNLIVVKSLYGTSTTTLIVPEANITSYTPTGSNGAYGSQYNPYNTDAGWFGPGFYYFPDYGNVETGQVVDDVATLDIYNLKIAGINLGAPYYNATVVSGFPYG